MELFEVKVGDTDQTVSIFIQDASSAVGDGLTGLAYNTSGLTAYYSEISFGSISLSLASQTTIGAHVDNGFCEINSTNMPGIYRYDIPDLASEGNVGKLFTFYFQGANNMVPKAFLLKVIEADEEPLIVAPEGSAGTGAIEYTLELENTDAVPVEEALVWITNTNDSNESVEAGSILTSPNGTATFYLDAGSYYRWAYKEGSEFTNPVSITVS